MKKMGIFSDFLSKMLTFVRHYMHFIFNKVFVNIKAVLQNYCTQVSVLTKLFLLSI